MSRTKEFLMSLAATTVSIVLTFGTTAIIDRKKKNDEKRQMVLMVMYDMRETIKEMELCSREITKFFDLQVEVVAHPDKYKRGFAELATLIPLFEYTTTTESIFKSNIETIKTIGNILFVEVSSSFYDNRSDYQETVILKFQQEASEAVGSYEGLYHFDSAVYPFYCQSYLTRMNGAFEQCKIMMKVTDEQLDVFSSEHHKLMDLTEAGKDREKKAHLDELSQRSKALFQARQEGKKNLK